MTREEQIFEASKKFSEYEYNQTNFENGFINGAKWADKHPTNVWHDAIKEPQSEYEIICQDTLENVWLINRKEDMKYHQTSWLECVMCECIVRWAYINDLLPKGGKKRWMC